MNKLLLLATSLFCLNLQGYTAGLSNQAGAPRTAVFNDSSKQTTTNPKAGFRDLFETGTSEGSTITRLNPKAVSFVQDYISSDGDRLTKMKGSARPYFDKISEIFEQHDLPAELKYLAVIESDLKSSATSVKGAAGPWQFMSATARDLGLKVNRSVDERRDFTKSTRAAARYLANLYDTYHDWLLVIAAYNSGPGNVNTAIRKSGSRNFWDLQDYLPAESRNHVKKFIATHYIMEGDGGLTTLTRKETEDLKLALAQPFDVDAAAQTVTGRYNSIAITQSIGMDITEFNKLNPNFDKQLSANGTYELRLPAEKMNQFQNSRHQILEQSLRLILSR